jgi:predicted aldo/keto reductase-like oxidoreductase
MAVICKKSKDGAKSYSLGQVKQMHKQKIIFSRRKFLKTGITGIVGAACLPKTFKTKTSSIQEAKDKKEFFYRTLGKTGIKLPVVSMGSMVNPALVKEAFDLGVVHIDTSGAHARGNNERIIGGIVKNMPRDSFVISTSTGVDIYKDRKTELMRKDADPDDIMRSFEGSLKRLGLEYVDIYYLAANWHRSSVLFEPFLKVVEKLKREGRIKFIGITTHQNEPEAIKAAAGSKVYDVVSTAYNFRQKHRGRVKEAIAYAADAGLGVVAFKTQAGVYWDKARKHMINMKAALKWVLQDPNVHTTVPAFNTYEEVKEGLSVMANLPLTPQEEADLKLGESMGWTGLYCQQCDRCLDQCPNDLDIPTLMRSYMYAFGYQDRNIARETLGCGAYKNFPCRDCQSCTVNCSLGFDVKSRALGLTQILA